MFGHNLVILHVLMTNDELLPDNKAFLFGPTIRPTLYLFVVFVWAKPVIPCENVLLLPLYEIKKINKAILVLLLYPLPLIIVCLHTKYSIYG
jgi:hypothetical protein